VTLRRTSFVVSAAVVALAGAACSGTESSDTSALCRATRDFSTELRVSTASKAGTDSPEWRGTEIALDNVIRAAAELGNNDLTAAATSARSRWADIATEAQAPLGNPVLAPIPADMAGRSSYEQEMERAEAYRKGMVALKEARTVRLQTIGHEVAASLQTMIAFCDEG
jgi:hypothetical protein